MKEIFVSVVFLITTQLVLLEASIVNAEEPADNKREKFCETQYPNKLSWQDYIVEAKPTGNTVQLFGHHYIKTDENSISDIEELIQEHGYVHDLLAEGKIVSKTLSRINKKTKERTDYFIISPDGSGYKKFTYFVSKEESKYWEPTIVYQDELTSDFKIIGGLKGYRLKEPRIIKDKYFIQKYDYINKDNCIFLTQEVEDANSYSKIEKINIVNNFSDDIFDLLEHSLK